MCTNKERSLDELMALSSIYGEFFQTNDVQPDRGIFRAVIELPSGFKIKDKSSDEELVIEYLPEMTLEFTLPSGYPSNESPVHQLTCYWLYQHQISRLENELDILWSENVGCEILFSWCNFLKNDALKYLQISPTFVVNKDLFCILAENNSLEKETRFSTSVFVCGICLEDKIGKNCLRLTGCGHVFCRDCLRVYCETEISGGNVKHLVCPEPECEERIPVHQTEISGGNVKHLVCSEPECGESIASHQVRYLVSDAVYSRYEKLLLKVTLSCSSDVQSCPAKGCDQPVIISEEGLGLCYTCQYAFCSTCRMTWHGVEPCRTKSAGTLMLERYRCAGVREREQLIRQFGKKYFDKLMNIESSEQYVQDNTKKCPKCHIGIEKSDGCNKMCCPRCHAYFCWLCLETLSRSDPYTHYTNPLSPCHNDLFYRVEELQDFLQPGEGWEPGEGEFWQEGGEWEAGGDWEGSEWLEWGEEGEEWGYYPVENYQNYEGYEYNGEQVDLDSGFVDDVIVKNKEENNDIDSMISVELDVLSIN